MLHWNTQTQQHPVKLVTSFFWILHQQCKTHLCINRAFGGCSIYNHNHLTINLLIVDHPQLSHLHIIEIWSYFALSLKTNVLAQQQQQQQKECDSLSQAFKVMTICGE